MRAPSIVVRLVTIAAIVRNVRACSDIKVFLAPREAKQQGIKITREAALDVLSNFVKLDGLRDVANEAVEHFDFDVGAFHGACQVPNDVVCNMLDCGCPATSSGPGRRLSSCGSPPIFSSGLGGGGGKPCKPRAVKAAKPNKKLKNSQKPKAGKGVEQEDIEGISQDFETVPINAFAQVRVLCTPFFGCSMGRRKLFGAKSGPEANVRAAPQDETIVAVCFGSKCKGFAVISAELVNNRIKRCGEHQDVIT